jgi:hypothetical protein
VGSIDDPAESARMLIEMANGAGGPDNITVIVVHVDGPGIPDATEADLLTFAHWRIDPETPVERESVTETYDGFGPPTASPTTEHRIVQPAVSPRRPTMELMSMAVIIGLILGSIVTGAALYRHGVRCRVQARTAGLTVLTDGHDSGARTSEGAVELRLPPGKHTVALRAAGSGSFGDREVQVEPGQACEVSFTEPATR